MNLTFDTVVKLLLNNDIRHYFELVNLSIVSYLIALFGVATNVVNLIVFIKQGLYNTVNVTLAALAISDLCSLSTLLLFDIWLSPLLTFYGVPIKATEVQHLTAGLPHGCFTRITSWITAYITAERCLCVSFPLQVKHLLTPRRTTIIICCIYVVVIASLLPEYISLYIDWRWDISSNRTLLGLVYRYSELHLTGLTFLMYSILMFLSFLTVATLTLILIIKLKISSRWRMSATLCSDQVERISNREQKAIKIALSLASLLILTFCPTIVATTCGFLVPDFSVSGQYANVFFLCWSFVMVFDAVNASVNIFIYYRMSSKFRSTLQNMFTSLCTVVSKPLRCQSNVF